MYGDFESLLRKYVVGSLDTTRNIYQEHLPLSVGYYLVSKINPSQSYYKSYIGSHPAKWFANELYNIAIDYQEVNILCCNYNILYFHSKDALPNVLYRLLSFLTIFKILRLLVWVEIY